MILKLTLVLIRRKHQFPVLCGEFFYVQNASHAASSLVRVMLGLFFFFPLLFLSLLFWDKHRFTKISKREGSERKVNCGTK
jgi:hypothetical protein